MAQEDDLTQEQDLDLEEEDEFDPLAQFRKASELQKGLPTASQDFKGEDTPKGDNEDDDPPSKAETSPKTETPSKGISGRLSAVSSKAIVLKGNEIQANLALAVWDWRTDQGYKTAKADLDDLISKTVQGSPLSDTERKRIEYSQEFIKTMRLAVQTSKETPR